MTVDQFFTFFNDIYCDYDGAYGDQCFDLANGYSRWIGGQKFTGATADLIYNQQPDFYTSIPNSPDNFPQKGDVVVWNWPHVGIATGNNTNANQFEVLEQNDPTGSNCHLKTYDYNGVIGWLRPKQLPQDNLDLQQQLDAKRIECDINWNMCIALFTALGVNLDPNNKDGSKQDALNKISQMNKQHDQDVQYIADIKKTDSKILDQDGKLAEQLLEAQHALQDITKKYQDFILTLKNILFIN